MGGVVLHDGKIAEMRTGEGKTLTATLAVALNALDGQGRARRHRQRLPGQARHAVDGPGLHALGLSVACIQHDERLHVRPGLGMPRTSGWRGLRPVSRREAYEADITYGTNNEFGFDYLRDNMVVTADRNACSATRLRHRRRGRQHPDRRSAHAADHLRAGRAGDRPLLPVRPDREAAARGTALRGRRQAQDGCPDRRRASTGSSNSLGIAARRKHLRRALHRTDPLPGAGAQGRTPRSTATRTTSSAMAK